MAKNDTGMLDDLEEKLERLCERFNIGAPWKEIALQRFSTGREEYGAWNHLSMSDAELADEIRAECADLLSYSVFIVWSRAYHAAIVNGESVDADSADEVFDEVVDPDLVDSVMEAAQRIDVWLGVPSRPRLRAKGKGLELP